MFFILFGAVWCLVMRLLSLQEDGYPTVTDDILDPQPYAILSHTWGSDHEEVSFQDVKLRPPGKDNAPGYRKIQFCAKQAAADGLQHVWIDTCCINKDNAVELQEAITSMYKWYQNSTRCYVYLSDVQFNSQNPTAWRASFRRSRWFSRGWTLQELLAPPSVEFFDKSGRRLGDKKTLKKLLQDITGIPEEALQGCQLSKFSVRERMMWIRNRHTKREEDKAYCLLGIFDISMFLNYGEGEAHAMDRLKREIELQPAKDYVAHLIVPSARNASFVGRHDILRDLSEMIPSSPGRQDCQPIAIHGLRGTGKTQIALEAAYGLREWHPEHYVYWVSAANRQDFEESYRKIAKDLGLPIVGADKSSRAKASAAAGSHKSPGTSDNEPDLKASVTAALSRSTASWLLIIDDLDDPELLSSAKSTDAIHDYLPSNEKGSILITTRKQEVAIKLGIAAGRTLSIGALTESDSLKMFETPIRPDQMPDEDITKELLRRLGLLPLAIQQAAAYLARTGITVDQFLESYRLPDPSRITLSSRVSEDREQNQHDTYTIAQTWLVATKYMISRDDPLAARYLNLVCFLAEKDIPLALFPEKADCTKRDKSLDVLRKHGLITDRFGDFFNIHPFVRSSRRSFMEPREAESCLNAIAYELSEQYPYAEYENQRICSNYMPHAEAILAITETTIDQELKAELLEKVGRSYTQLGQNDIAKQKHYEAWQLRHIVLGESHPDTLISMHSLAITLTDLGRYKQAEHMYRSVLRLRQGGIGPKHPDTLASEDDLGRVLYLLENYDEAERYHRNALEFRRSELGEDHVDTLHSKNNLALVLGAVGRYAEAEQAHREQQELCEKKFGPRHPETLCSMNNRALMMKELGQYEQARALFQKCLSLRQEELGREHPHTLNSHNNLALVLGDLGKLEEAAQMHREELRLCEKTLGPEHPDVLISMSNLALVLEKAAKQIFQRREERRQKSQESQVLFDMCSFDERGLDRPATRSSHVRHALGTNSTFTSTSDNDIDNGQKTTRPTTVAKQVPSTDFSAREKATAIENIRSVNSDADNDQLQPPDDAMFKGLEAKWFVAHLPAYWMKLRPKWTQSRLKGDIGRSLTIGGFIFVMIAAINFLTV